MACPDVRFCDQTATSFAKDVNQFNTAEMNAALVKCQTATAKLRDRLNNGAQTSGQRTAQEQSLIASLTDVPAKTGSEWRDTIATVNSWKLPDPGDMANMGIEAGQELAVDSIETYLREGGWPASPDEARRQVEQQASGIIQEQLRLPPGLADDLAAGRISPTAVQRAAVNLAVSQANQWLEEEYGFSLENFPTSRGAAELMAEQWAEAAIQQQTGYSIPVKMPSSLREGVEGGMLVIYTITCYELGIDPNIGMTALSSLGDFSLDHNDCAAIGATAGGIACGAALQAYGVPYPIGAFIGSQVGAVIGEALADYFSIGTTEEEAAQEALEKACRDALKIHESYSISCNQMRDAYFQELEQNRKLLEGAWRSIEQSPSVGVSFKLRYFPIAPSGGQEVVVGQSATHGLGTSMLGVLRTAAKFASCTNSSGCTYVPASSLLYPEVSASADRVTAAILARLGGDFPFHCPGCTPDEAGLAVLDAREDEILAAGFVLTALMREGAYRDALFNEMNPGAFNRGARGVTIGQYRAWVLAKLDEERMKLQWAPARCSHSCFGQPWLCEGVTTGFYGPLSGCDREFRYLSALRDGQVQFARLRAAIAQVKADLIRTAAEIAAQRYAELHAEDIRREGTSFATNDTSTTIAGMPAFSVMSPSGAIITFAERQKIMNFREKVAPVLKAGALVGGFAVLGYALARRFRR